MPDQILISGLRLIGKHGVHEFEKQFLQPFEVDLALEVDLKPAGISDQLADTVSYVDVIDATKAVVEGESYDLIERLAQRIAEVSLVDERVVAVVVTVRKPHAAVGVDMAYTAVQIYREA